MRMERPPRATRVAWSARILIFMRMLLAGLLGLVVLGACSATGVPEENETSVGVPAFAWQESTPAAVGLDPVKLKAEIDAAKKHKSACFVVVKDGQLVSENYWRGETAETNRVAFSVTKSIASTLVGIAQADGDLKITDKASKYIPEWRGTPSEDITIRNLLANDSGREWTPSLDYEGLFSTNNMSEFAVELGQMAEPGDVWAYNNAAIQTLDRILFAATGNRPYEMARDRIFEPLGMNHTRIASDSAAQSTNLAAGMLSTCMDLARFGLMIEQGGEWEGEQIVPKEWIEEATGSPSQKLNAAYGYLWWLNRKGEIREPMDAGSTLPPRVVVGRNQEVPGAPRDMFAAVGFGGQIVMIDPGSRTIVVRLGEPNVDGQISTYGFRDAAKVVTRALDSGA